MWPTLRIKHVNGADFKSHNIAQCLPLDKTHAQRARGIIERRREALKENHYFFCNNVVLRQLSSCHQVAV